jgi:polyisoprenoid-binding protein YceI
VDMTTLKSDEDNRDRKFKGEIMETSTYPTATFMITQPIDLGTVPADGTEITASATGDLTLHGVTKSVTLEVKAQRNGTIIDVLGSTNVKFADYKIDNPSNGAVTTADNGTIEFLLTFTKS